MLPQKCMTPTEPVREVPPESGEPVAPAADTDGSVQHADGETSVVGTPSATDTGQGAAQHADGETAAPQTLASTDTAQREPDPRVKGYKFLPVEPSGEDETVELSEGHQQLIKALVEHIRTDNPFPVIGLEGAWGSGKSTILARVMDQLRERALVSNGAELPLVVTFNAWTHQNDLALRALVEAVVAAAEDAPKEAKQASQAAEEAAAKAAADNEAAAKKAASTKPELPVKEATVAADAAAQRHQDTPAPASVPSGQDDASKSGVTASDLSGPSGGSIPDWTYGPGADKEPRRATADLPSRRTAAETLELTNAFVAAYCRSDMKKAIEAATETKDSLRSITQITTRTASPDAESLAIAAACVPVGAALVSVFGEDVVVCWPQLPDCLPHIGFLGGMMLALLPLFVFALQLRRRTTSSKPDDKSLAYEEKLVSARGTEPTTIEAETEWRKCIAALTGGGAFTRIVLVLDDIDRLDGSQLERLWPVLTFLLGSKQRRCAMQGKLVAVVPFDRQRVSKILDRNEPSSAYDALVAAGWLLRLLPASFRIPANPAGSRLEAMPELLRRALPDLPSDERESVLDVWTQVSGHVPSDDYRADILRSTPRAYRSFVNCIVASMVTAPEFVRARNHAIHSRYASVRSYEADLVFGRFKQELIGAPAPVHASDWTELRSLYYGVPTARADEVAVPRAVQIMFDKVRQADALCQETEAKIATLTLEAKDSYDGEELQRLYADSWTVFSDAHTALIEQVDAVSGGVSTCDGYDILLREYYAQAQQYIAFSRVSNLESVVALGLLWVVQVGSRRQLLSEHHSVAGAARLFAWGSLQPIFEAVVEELNGDYSGEVLSMAKVLASQVLMDDAFGILNFAPTPNARRGFLCAWMLENLATVGDETKSDDPLSLFRRSRADDYDAAYRIGVVAATGTPVLFQRVQRGLHNRLYLDALVDAMRIGRDSEDGKALVVPYSNAPLRVLLQLEVLLVLAGRHRETRKIEEKLWSLATEALAGPLLSYVAAFLPAASTDLTESSTWPDNEVDFGVAVAGINTMQTFVDSVVDDAAESDFFLGALPLRIRPRRLETTMSTLRQGLQSAEVRVLYLQIFGLGVAYVTDRMDCQAAGFVFAPSLRACRTAAERLAAMDSVLLLRNSERFDAFLESTVTPLELRDTSWLQRLYFPNDNRY